MNVKDLSDFQLFSLVMDKSLPSETRGDVEEEFEKRDFSLIELDKLSLQFETLSEQKEQEGLTLARKIFIVLIPLFSPLQAIIANRYLSKSKSKQHWNFMILGYLFWFVILLLLGKYLIFN